MCVCVCVCFSVCVSVDLRLTAWAPHSSHTVMLRTDTAVHYLARAIEPHTCAPLPWHAWRWPLPAGAGTD